MKIECSLSSGSQSSADDDSDVDTAQVAVASFSLTVVDPSINSQATTSTNDYGNDWTCSASYGLRAVVLVPRGLLSGLLLDNSSHTQ